ncbi:hypothetical protein Q7O_002320 [Pectobacterium carotovorum subsp. carotovorum PCCS1]|nr:hypothetical protein [Pectobacterium carotovorum subsp. carotovorum PCCS1]
MVTIVLSRSPFAPLYAVIIGKNPPLLSPITRVGIKIFPDCAIYDRLQKTVKTI